MESNNKSSSNLINTNLGIQLKIFRKSHKKKILTLNNTEWHYYLGGNGKTTILLLTGGLGEGEALFSYIMEFEKKYKVIAPSFPKVSTITELVDGIKSILQAEDVQHFHVMGQSLGGIIAQELMCRFPDIVRKAVLSHTTTNSNSVDKKSFELTRRKLVQGTKLVKFLPLPLIKMIFKKKITGLLSGMKEDEKNFWSTYFSELIDSKTKDDEVASYSTMLDFADNYNYSFADFSHMKEKVLILESELDNAFDLDQKSAVKELFPDALVHTFKDTGHLTIITAQEEFMRVMKDFLED